MTKRLAALVASLFFFQPVALACSCAPFENTLEERIRDYKEIYVVRLDKTDRRPSPNALSLAKGQNLSDEQIVDRVGMIERARLTVTEVFAGTFRRGDRFSITRAIELGSCSRRSDGSDVEIHTIDGKRRGSVREWAVFESRGRPPSFSLCGDTRPLADVEPDAVARLRHARMPGVNDVAVRPRTHVVPLLAAAKADWPFAYTFRLDPGRVVAIRKALGGSGWFPPPPPAKSGAR